MKKFAPMGPIGQGRTVYIRSVLAADLPDDVREQIGNSKVMFSVHSDEGEQLAFVSDRTLAFELAKQHDFVPVAVH